MKTLFLVAKYYASAEDADNIGLEHIRKALQHVNVLDQEAWLILHSVLFKETPFILENIPLKESQNFISLLPEIEKAPIVQFDAEVKELIKKLKEKGIFLSSEVSVIDGVDIYKQQEEYLYDLQKPANRLGLPADVIQEFVVDFLQQAKDEKDKLYSICLKEDEYNLIDKQELDKFHTEVEKLWGVAANLEIDNLVEILNILKKTSASMKIKNYLDRFYTFIKELALQMESKEDNKGVDLIKAAKIMKNTLAEKIYGQEKAISVVSDSIKNNILASEKAPKATYFFLGPPATGKTYLAELMGEQLTEYKVKKFDMTQFSHVDSGGTLYGTSRMWGNAKPGSLTSFVRNNPKSIIILDEFEKANNQVQTNLLTVFGGGYLNDVCGWCKVEGEEKFVPWGSTYDEKEVKCPEDEIIDRVDFSQTIFVITSNLGKELYSDHKFLELVDEDYMQAESMILDAIRREEKQDNQNGGEQPAIVPELISRLSKGNVVLFNKLTYKAFEVISDKAFRDYKDAFCEQFNVKFPLDESYEDFLKAQILSFAPELDARRLQSKIGINFFDRVTDYIMILDQDTGYCKEIKIAISPAVTDYFDNYINGAIKNDTLVKELFRKNKTLNIEESFSDDNGVLTYRIESCELKIVKRIKDFGEDGLVFEVPEQSFADVAGHNRAKMRLKEVVTLLKDPKILKEFDVGAPKGMLLYGPPGTGKTMLAKAFANEADLPFIATTGTDLLDTKKTTEIFSKAKEYAPSIVFIDEIDALGKRGENNGREIPINKLLSEIDGFSSTPEETVFVVAATNYKENIDDAIIRAGRIELHIKIDNLDRDARRFFLNRVINEKPVSGDFDMEKLLMYTAGMTGAELEMVGKEASIYCIRNGFHAITQEILIEQINTIKYGERLTHLFVEKMIEETAIHEAGHALLSHLLMPHKKIEQITVTARDKALGFVSYDREENYNNMTVQDFKNNICIAMAGRVSQIKKFGDIEGIDTGASNDLEQATYYAYIAIAHYGMDEEVGYINISGIGSDKYSHEKIDKAVDRWLQEGKEKTKEFVEKHWSTIEKLAKMLLEKEVLYGEDLKSVFHNKLKNI